jgi:hypothetical protein
LCRGQVRVTAVALRWLRLQRFVWVPDGEV